MNHKKNIIILTVIFIIFSILTWGKTGSVLIDFSREAYIPYQIINGDVLAKDIFLIYGAFGYILNSILYKFTTNINILHLEAHLISFVILILFYYILNVFFAKKVSLIFSIIFIVVSLFSNSTFSFVMPYSYSTLWAILGIYCALFSLLYNKNKLLFLSLGLILSCKIEYFIPIFIISIIFVIKKRIFNPKDILFALIFPAICLFYFAIVQINFADIIQNFEYIKKMSQTDAIKSLYKGMGCFFYWDYFIYNLVQGAKLLSVGLISYLFWLIKKPVFSYTVAIIGFTLTNNSFAMNLGIFFAIFLTINSIKNKNITKDEIILFLFATILCSKSIFALNPLGYANFGYCLMIYYLFLQAQKIINKKWLINLLIIFFVFCFVDIAIHSLNNRKHPATTQIGKMYLSEKNIETFKGTNQFIKKHIKKDENILVLPEGQIFNLINKKPYEYYNSTFTPLDFQTFGEKNLIKQLEKNQTDYIIFYPRDTKEYGAQSICFDYAVDFCKYIIDNYSRTGTIKNEKNVTIYKIKR